MLYSLEKLLPRNGIVLIEPADYVEANNGVIQISSGGEIIADYWEKNSQTITDTPASDRNGNSAFFISHFSPFDNLQYIFSLLNAGQEPVKAEIQFYSSDGKKFSSKEVSLEPYEQFDNLAERYFDGARLGTIIVRGDNKSLMVTSHIFDLKNNLHLGKARALVIR